jgi:CHASE3 domain sensor protein
MNEKRAGSKAVFALLAVFLTCTALKPILSQGQYSVSLVVPKPAYVLGFPVTVYARVTLDGVPFSGAVVLWELKDPNGVRRDFGQSTTNATGYATISIATAPDWPPGAYNLTVAVSGTSAKASATVNLKRDRVLVTGFNVPLFNRVNANSTQRIGFKLQYESDGALFSDAATGNRVWVNGTEAQYDATDGFWYITYTANLGKFTFVVTGIHDELRKSSEFLLKTGLEWPSVIWDAILIKNWSIADPDRRVNVNSTQSIYFNTIYWYDSLPLEGTITLNGTFSGSKWVLGKGIEVNVTYAKVANVTFIPTSVADRKFGLTVFVIQYQQHPWLVWDQVLVSASRVSDDRADVGSLQWIEYQLIYDFDKKPVTGGVVKIAGIDASHVGSGWWRRVNVTSDTVGKVIAPVTFVNATYAITVFKHVVPPVEVIFDMVIFELTAPPRLSVGTAVGDRLKVSAYYAYDKTPFVGTYVVIPDPYQIVSGVSAVKYSVAQMVETKYHLLLFRSFDAVVKYDRLIVEKYSVDNNADIVHFVIAFETDKAAAGAEVKVLAGGVELGTVTTTPDGVGLFNFTPYLDVLLRATSVKLLPVRALDYEVSVGVETEIPVKKLVKVFDVEPTCQDNTTIRVDGMYADGTRAPVTATLSLDTLERREVTMSSGETLKTVLKPGINTVTLDRLLLGETTAIVPNDRAFLGMKKAYNVSLKLELSLPKVLYTGYVGAVLSGVINASNTGNVSLCNVQVLLVLEGAGVRKEALTQIAAKPGEWVEVRISDMKVSIAYYSGNFTVSVEAFYEPGRNRLDFVTAAISFVREMPEELADAFRLKAELWEDMRSWDREFFDKELDKLYSDYKTGALDVARAVARARELYAKLKTLEGVIKAYKSAFLKLSSLSERYRDRLECMGLAKLSEELKAVEELWKQLKYEEALQRLTALLKAIELVDSYSDQLNNACRELAAVPEDHKKYAEELFLNAVSLQMQNKTQEAIQTLTNALQVVHTMVTAWRNIRSAEEAVRRAESEGRLIGLDRARSLLNEARNLFDQRNYADASRRAVEAKEAADAALNLTLVATIALIVVMAIIVVGYLAYKVAKARKVLK